LLLPPKLRPFLLSKLRKWHAEIFAGIALDSLMSRRNPKGLVFLTLFLREGGAEALFVSGVEEFACVIFSWLNLTC
jgi:hypothetical protein